MKKYTLLLALPLLAALTISSCVNKNKKITPANTTTPAAGPNMVTDIPAIQGVDMQESTSTLTTEGDIRGGEFTPQADIKTVNFDYDRYELSDEMRQILQENATLIKARKDMSILVEGHCDDRGTTEYNLALGQKRASSVRDYYVRLGVPENSIGTISYGEEKPLCTEATDACWLQNRRAETKTKGK